MKAKSFLKGLATGAVVGAAIGVATGLLTAPKSGKELRAELADYSKRMRKDVEKMLKNAKQVSRDVYENAVDEVTAMYEKVKSFDKKDLLEIKENLMNEWETVVKKFQK
ncbi:YtxH domain-containing protein [bacterium]|nr:YtxH domain-containing protein [bacterium]